MHLDTCRQLYTVGMSDLLNNWIWSSCLLSKLPTWSTNVPVFGGNHDLVAYFKIRFSAMLIGLNSLLMLCLSQALLGLLPGFSKAGYLLLSLLPIKAYILGRVSGLPVK